MAHPRHPNRALLVSLAAILLAAAAGAAIQGSAAISLGWYDAGTYCDDGLAANPGAGAPCRYDAREDWTGAMCADGVDNDSDERTDCLDPDCPACPTACPKTERDSDGDCERDEEWFFSAHACANSADDDGDLATDCADSDCAGYISCAPEICRNGLDDDGDGQADCSDDGCYSSGECSACVNSPSPENCDPLCAGTAEVCGDGIDQDCDGSDRPCDGPVCGDGTCEAGESCAADCDNPPADCNSDTDCPSGQTCGASGKCEDGYEDCGDNYCDEKKGECSTCVEDCTKDYYCKTEECENGYDDDGDNAVDCDDTDCKLVDDVCTTEKGNCTDGKDNDSDGDIDCGDGADCGDSPECAGEGCNNEGSLDGGNNCFDGYDNDMDGNSDCNDSGCGQCISDRSLFSSYPNWGFFLNPVSMEDVELRGSVEACGGFSAADGVTPYGGVKTTVYAYQARAGQCKDGSDNEADGYTDCEDTDCCWSRELCPDHRIADGFCWENLPDEECSNGQDDDGDGQVDCADTDCRYEAACNSCSEQMKDPCFVGYWDERYHCNEGGEEKILRCVDWSPALTAEEFPPNGRDVKDGHWEYVEG